MDIIHNTTTILTMEEINLMEEKLIDSYIIMRSDWYLVALIGSYLFFVLSLGPRLMKNRPPFNLKYVMIFYNFLQLLYNSWFLFLVFSKSNILQYVYEQSCYPSYDRPLDNRIFYLNMAWMWLVLKIIDLVDTIFFVLRKKQSHVTFLHIYHHTVLVLIVWFHMRYVRGEQSGWIAILNAVVHFFMYLYYLLAALGPEVQRYLWWKRYITRLQLVQFLMITAIFLHLMISCDLPTIHKIYNYFILSQCVMFTALFLNFYIKAYTRKSAKPDEKSN